MKLPSFIIPILIFTAIAGGYQLRNAFTQPTTNVEFEFAGSESVTCTVQGVKCKGTANFFTALYDGVPGISSIETYASEHRVVFRYNPAQITSDRIREIMEAPIPLRDGTTRQVFVCESME